MRSVSNSPEPFKDKGTCSLINPVYWKTMVSTDFSGLSLIPDLNPLIPPELAHGVRGACARPNL
jgi:hypothetical protein